LNSLLDSQSVTGYRLPHPGMSPVYVFRPGLMRTCVRKMPWKPSYTEAQARAAIEASECWADVLRELGLKMHGKNLATLRKWIKRWEIVAPHLPEYRRSEHRARFTEVELREAVAASFSWSETLRYLRYRSQGGNWRTLKKYVALWEIDTSHFDPQKASIEGLRRSRSPRPLEELLVEGSRCKRAYLKRRLYKAGLKTPFCELCGQGEEWRDKRMAMILDHINGVPDDNRLSNLQIVCPNCAATLDTHCGRKNRRPERACMGCGEPYRPKRSAQKYCSRTCGQRAGKSSGLNRRISERPPREELLRLIDEFGYVGVGRLFGVSDNAIRKWVRFYERERAIEEGRDPNVVEIPKRTWPNRRRDEAA
jgi:hypothetical protein